MKWNESTVTKLLISEVKSLDDITVYLENYTVGRGKITIEICGDSYSSFWGAMGGRTIEQFVLDCDNHYLSKNLVSLSALSSPNYDGFVKNVRKQLIENRRRYGESKKLTRKLWDLTKQIEPCESYFHDRSNHSLLHDVAGDDWWYLIDDVDSDLYVYLCRILDALKACLKARKTVQEGK